MANVRVYTPIKASGIWNEWRLICEDCGWYRYFSGEELAPNTEHCRLYFARLAEAHTCASADPGGWFDAGVSGWWRRPC